MSSEPEKILKQINDNASWASLWACLCFCAACRGCCHLGAIRDAAERVCPPPHVAEAKP